MAKVKCSKCDGEGRVYEHDFQMMFECDKCKGTGYVETSSPSAPAPSARSGGSSSDLTGTKWIQGKGKPFANIYKFMPDGIIGNGGLRGKWSQNGNSVTFSFGSEMSKSTTDCKIVSSNTMKGKMKIEYLQTFSASGKNYKKGDIEYRDWDLEKM